MKYSCWIGWTALIAIMLAMGLATQTSKAQEPQVKVITAASKRCTCGRWTCPICQQRRAKELCPPGQSVQSVPILPSSPSMPGAMPNATPPQFHMEDGVPGLSPKYTPSPSDEQTLAPITPGAPGAFDGNFNQGTGNLTPEESDVARALDASPRAADQRGFLASNTGGLADPGLFGDFFGPTSNTNSIVSQNYTFDAVGSFNGTSYDFDIPATNSPNDFTSVGSGNSLTLLAPSTQNDVVQPTAPGWRYGQGTATLIDPYTDTYRLQYSYLRDISVPSSFAQQRMKLAENTSPIPQNRVFVNYSLFQNVPLENGINVNRITPGFETLLFSPNTSFELRTPMATTLSSDILAEGGTNTNQVEFGNMFFSLKHVVRKRANSLVSTGMSMTVPTADSTRVFSAGREILRVDNQSVHLMPFIGGYYRPSARSFTQGVIQVDVDANGNTVKSNQNYNQTGLTTIGRLQDMTLLYVDTNVGYWVYRNSGRGLTGIAPIIEGHYNRSLNTADCVIDGVNGTRIQLPVQQYDNFNFVAATVFEFNQRSRLGIGYGAPIGNGTDRSFDGEFRVTFNRYY